MPEPYPWFSIAEGRDLQQGDIFDDCPVFAPSSELTIDDGGAVSDTTVEWEHRSVITLTQSCDLAQSKVSEVLLCALWKKTDFGPTDPFTKTDYWERGRKGLLPPFHILNECKLTGFERDFHVADFRRIFSLPIGFLKRFAERKHRHLRLMPPYREHLSQGFARFFMRVGLPQDIPPFK